LLSFEAQAGNLVEVNANHIDKLFTHWKQLIKKNGGEL